MPHIYMPDTASANSKDKSLQFPIADYRLDVTDPTSTAKFLYAFSNSY